MSRSDSGLPDRASTEPARRGANPPRQERAAGSRAAATVNSAPKMRRTQAERSQETRARILEAAVELMRKRGYAQFRIADVARAAGVSRGAQLHHFATKEKLVFATLEHVFHKALATSRTKGLTSRYSGAALEI